MTQGDRASSRFDPTIRPIRITVDGAEPIVIGEAPASDPMGRTHIVTPVPTSATERVEGIRRFEVVVDGWRFEVTTEPQARAELRDQASRTREKGHHAREQVR